VKKLSELRQNILKILEESEVPLTVESIREQLTLKPNLSSIYRSLLYLEEKEKVISLSFGTPVRFYCPNSAHPTHYLFCKKCQSIQVFHVCFAHEIQQELELENDFMITDHVFYFTGYCRHCRAIERSDANPKDKER
jgi:Fur family ferric uptake transcriptional regulator